MKLYALYKGENLLATGTLVQIAYKMGVSIKTIKFYSSPTYKKRNKKNFRELIRL